MCAASDAGLPWFALIRGPFAGTGYQVATLARAEEAQPSIVLLFSKREAAQRYLARKPGGHPDWKVGTLPTWSKVLYFLEHVTASVQYYCLDGTRDEESDDVLVPLESALPELRRRVRAECGR